MNAIISAANDWAAQVIPLLWQATWQGGLFIVAVWIACRLIKVPASIRSWLWWIASLQLMVRLALPGPLQLRVLPATSAPLPAVELAQYPVSAPQGGLAPVVDVLPATPIPPPVHPGFELLLAAGWILGIAVFAAVGLTKMRRTRKLLRGAWPISDAAATAEFLGLCRELKVRPCLLLESSVAPCPLLAGFVRPAIVLPDSIFERTSAELKMALAHELIHLKRRDLWLGVLPAVGQTVMFFNPLAWLCPHEFNAASEEEADLSTLRLTGGSAVAYARLLLNSTRTSAPLTAVGAALTFRLLRRRITMLNRSISQTTTLQRKLSKVAIALAAAFVIPWTLGAQQAPKPAHNVTVHRLAKKRHAAKSKTVFANRLKNKTVHTLVHKPAAARKATSSALVGATAPGYTVLPVGTTVSMRLASPTSARPSVALRAPAPSFAATTTGVAAGSTAPKGVASAPVAWQGTTLSTGASRAESETIGTTSTLSGATAPSAVGLQVAGVQNRVSTSGGGLAAHFYHADLVSALTQLFDAADENYVISPDIREASVTCSLKNLPLETAISAILKCSHQDLTWRREAGVWYIEAKS